MSKLDKTADKKMALAKKMGKSLATKNIVEGDYQELGPQDRFNKRDVRKTIKGRSEKHGKMPSSDWEI